MIICINCRAETKAKMDTLLGRDQYVDYSELVAVAVENLWILDREVAEKGALVIGEGLEPAVIPLASPPAGRASPGSAGAVPAQSRQSKAISAPLASREPDPVRIPELFLFEGLEQPSTATMQVPSVENLEETFTLDRWLFGQYNKLLPAKANCRALVRLTVGQENGALLDTIAGQIAEAAALLGDYLAGHDRRHQIGRDDALATAFPRSGPDAEKSRARYANHFVGSVNSQGVLSGLLCDYRLTALAPGEGARLLPTEPAVQFAELSNPVLDTCQTAPTQKFSPEEAAFILKHIYSHVPVEAFAFRTLIHDIADGANTPNKLDEALRVLVPIDTNRSLSPSFLTSQRSGTLSRMADLGLVARIRKGVRVSYIVTEQGQHFIESK